MPQRLRPQVSPEGSPSQPSAAKPLYVCPGGREVTIPIGIFPIGFGVAKFRKCPGRDVCLWFAAHDLGGADLITDFPAEAVLEPGFRAFPFSCPQFRDIVSKRRGQKSKRYLAAVKRWIARIENERGQAEGEQA